MENGKYSEEEKVILQVKFENEIRLCLGVAVLMDQKGKKKGVRLEAYNYSGKMLLSIKDFEAKIAAEINRVKNLSSASGYWINNNRKEGILYQDDKLSILKDISIKKEEKLAEHGIHTLNDLKGKTDKEIQEIATVITGISRKGLLNFREKAKKCKEENKPLVIDHHKAKNPYLSKFGGDWEKHIKNCAALSPYRCITDIVQHIYTETKKTFEGTKYEDNFFFYHDALSLMTAKETVK